jgi:phosphatidylglycerol:prolipoprotein diacylglycerol transferase
VPIKQGMDIVAPCLVLALGIGRIGCFLNGCCYGSECSVPWAVTYPYRSIPFKDQFYEHKLTPPNPELIDPITRMPAEIKALSPELQSEAHSWRSLPVHPSQLYSTISSLLIAGVLLCHYTLPHAAGRTMALMFLLEGPSRFLLEMLRVEPPVLGPFSLSMVLGMLFGVVGIILWIVFGKLSGPVAPEPALA